MICNALEKSGFRTKIAPEDADRLIVETAIENARLDCDGTVVIVGEDTDLLVLLCQLTCESHVENIYFCKESKGSAPNEYFSSNSFKYPELKKIIAFLHAFCGCDTTSCFYKKGKNKLFEVFSPEELLELASVFHNVNATSDDIANSAFRIIRDMYSTQAEKQLIKKTRNFSLGNLRYLHFSKAELKSSFSLETLPPTESAAKQHAFRVYYQIQRWLGNENLAATDWGWYMKNNHLMPVRSTMPPIPKKLLDQISCSCSKKGCVDASCTCKKSGLKCTNLCANCTED